MELEADLKIFTDYISESAREQIAKTLQSPAMEGACIRIMPDVHTGMDIAVGFTARVSNGRIMPNVIGVDIGCGISIMPLSEAEIDYMRLDNFVSRNIPSGQSVHQRGFNPVILPRKFFCSMPYLKNTDRLVSSIGTLGGGNHFIEIDRDSSGNLYLIVHSGSRQFGVQVASYYQELASSNSHAYLEGADFINYMSDMRKCVEFAKINRDYIIQTIIEGCGLHPKQKRATHIVHNYIEQTGKDEYIIRKGSISARDGEKVLISLNMQRGCIVGIGKGNPDWNFSAPHGAGRKLSRNTAFDTLSIDDFRSQMDGIYTSSVNVTTLDEAPEAYKDPDMIIRQLDPVVRDMEALLPMYNFKAHTEYRRYNKKEGRKNGYGKVHATLPRQ